MVGWSEEEIVSSNNSIIIDNNRPVIVYSRRTANGSLLNVDYGYGSTWDEEILDVNDDVQWIGVVRTNRGRVFSSSSTSSLQYSSHSSSSSSSSFIHSESSSSLAESSSSSGSESSSSVGESSSSSDTESSSSVGESSSSSMGESSSSSSSFGVTSSSSSFGESSSSSSLMESSSSSIGESSSSSSFGESSSSSVDSSSSSSSFSSESSSSSSLTDSNTIICTYSSDSRIRIYSSSLNTWRTLGENTFEIDNIESLKISPCGNKVGFTYYDAQGIWYNFFDIDLSQWDFSSFQLLPASIFDGNLIDYAVAGSAVEEQGVLSIAWLEDQALYFNVRMTTVDSYGTQGSGSTTVFSKLKTAQTTSYIVSGFNKIGIALDDNANPQVFVAGAETNLFVKNIRWNKILVDIEGIGDGIVPSDLVCAIHSDSSKFKVFFVNANWDVYYFEGSDENGFNSVYPELAVLNGERAFLTQWSRGELEGTDIYCTYTNHAGDLLKESKSKVLVVVDDNEDPYCYTSSSSSSSSSTSGGYTSESSCHECCKYYDDPIIITQMSFGDIPIGDYPFIDYYPPELSRMCLRDPLLCNISADVGVWDDSNRRWTIDGIEWTNAEVHNDEVIGGGVGIGDASVDYTELEDKLIELIYDCQSDADTLTLDELSNIKFVLTVEHISWRIRERSTGEIVWSSPASTLIYEICMVSSVSGICTNCDYGGHYDDHEDDDITGWPSETQKPDYPVSCQALTICD
ncbi:MAG: hypothetical protein WC119_02105 [Synergistaceae bacterium]